MKYGVIKVKLGDEMCNFYWTSENYMYGFLQHKHVAAEQGFFTLNHSNYCAFGAPILKKIVFISSVVQELVSE